MLHTIIIIFAFYSLTFAIKESPLFDKPRIWLIGKHPFFYKLFECYYCCGWWSGLVVYFVASTYTTWNIWDMILWGLAGSGISFFLNAVVERLLK